MRKYKRTLCLVALATAVMILATSGLILAHETRAVGPYEFVWGGTDEPVITGQRMWMELRVSDRGTGEPVVGAEAGLTVAFEIDGTQGEFQSFRTVYGQEGRYRVPVIFTEPGEYMMHLEGEIDGNMVHTHFAFVVDDHADLQFP